MITRLHFKNWRSLKDAEINFTTPITVFIGANSSGKTNIIDALLFMRRATEKGVQQASMERGGREKIHTLGTEMTDPIELAISFRPSNDDVELTYTLGIKTDIEIMENLSDCENNDFLKAGYSAEEGVHIRGIDNIVYPVDTPPWGWEETVLSSFGRTGVYGNISIVYFFIAQRWQILLESFTSPSSISIFDMHDLNQIHPNGANLPLILNNIKAHTEIYAYLLKDLQWILSHVDDLNIEDNQRELRLMLKEKQLDQQVAPTISGGTSRMIAMLAAFYILDINSRRNSMPGLVAIEEPDTALNPWLLQNFVEQLRNYTERDGHPRQVILTTHNPMFLNYFKPEEVRVVERDEQGYTHVNEIPEYVHDIWLKDGKYGLGEVWTTNSFGGLTK